MSVTDGSWYIPPALPRVDIATSRSPGTFPHTQGAASPDTPPRMLVPATAHPRTLVRHAPPRTNIPVQGCRCEQIQARTSPVHVPARAYPCGSIHTCTSPQGRRCAHFPVLMTPHGSRRAALLRTHIPARTSLWGHTHTPVPALNGGTYSPARTSRHESRRANLAALIPQHVNPQTHIAAHNSPHAHARTHLRAQSATTAHLAAHLAVPAHVFETASKRHVRASIFQSTLTSPAA
ncbi:hypothetical protein K438DRAFT_1967460 [Mycena galopus ATCC 62051]|nr:hypothetical protein K438DRAFT_1967460 [Mycena galopus ATCC 62051]